MTSPSGSNPPPVEPIAAAGAAPGAIDLPEAMAALRPRLGEAVAALEERTPYAAALLSSRGGLSILVERAEETITQLPRAAGAVVSAFDGQVLVERSVPGFDSQGWQRAVDRLRRDLPASSRRGDGRDADPAPQDFVTVARLPARALSLEDKLERCRELRDRVAGYDPRIVNVRVSYTELRETSVFRSRTADLAQDITRLRLQVFVILGQNGDIRYDWLSRGGTGGWELVEIGDDELAETVAGAARLFSSERIEPGEYAVVTGQGVSGVLAHESFGHGVETDLFPKERARATDYVGRRVGSPLVTIIDDPSLPAAYSSYFFDDEGMLSRPAVIVEQGVFRGGITDMVSAHQLGIPRTANGRRQDYTRKPYARMSNTFFGPGQTPLQDMLAQVERGVYLERWVNGMEDPQGWGIQITCHYGREIRGGKITDRVFAPVSISGYVPQVLETIRAVSPSVALDQGTCGKGHKELVPNSSGGPHLLLQVHLG